MIIGVLDFFLRLVAAMFAVGAALIIVFDNEDGQEVLTLVPGLPDVYVPVPAKWQYIPTVWYFLLASAIAAGYALFSSLLSLVFRGRKKGIVASTMVLDIAMVALLICGFGALLGVGFIAYNGNTYFEWDEVCSYFVKFCPQAGAAMGLAALAAFVFYVLALIGVFNLQRTPSDRGE